MTFRPYTPSDINDGDFITQTDGKLVGGNPHLGVQLVRDMEVLSFPTITAAMAVALSGDTLILGPGTYAESFTIPAGVIVSGQLPSRDVVITGSAATGTRVTLSNGSTLRRCTVQIPTDAMPAITFAGLAGQFAILDEIITVGQGGLGVGISNTGAGTLFAKNLTHLSGNANVWVRCTAGRLSLSVAQILFGLFTDDILRLDGGTLSVETLIAGAGSSATRGCNVQGSGILNLSNAQFNNVCTTALYVGSENVTLTLVGCGLEGITYDIDTLSSLTGVGTTYSINTCVLRGEKVSYTLTYFNNITINASFLDRASLNDKATRILGKLSVGLPGKGADVCVGEGDAIAINSEVHSFNGVATFVDNSAAAQSPTASTFSLFQGTATGNICYIGNRQYPFTALEIKTTTPINVGFGSYVFEYWNGSTWVGFNYMVTQAAYPFATYAKSAFTLAETTQIRLPWDMTDWTTTTINGKTAFFIRIRLTGAITTVPLLEQIKFHRNSVTINENGFIEYFGNSRFNKALLWHYELIQPVNGNAPGNGNLSFSANITLSGNNNRYADGALDASGGIVEIPHGLDTSIPLVFKIYWITSAVLGNVQWVLRIVPTPTGSLITGLLTEVSYTQTTTVPLLGNSILSTSFNVDVSTLKDTEFFAFSLSRDARLVNLSDTAAGNVDVIKAGWYGTFWHG